jgi:hypothetical protein
MMPPRSSIQLRSAAIVGDNDAEAGAAANDAIASWVLFGAFIWRHE